LSAPTYAQLVRELFPRLSGGIRWGLERTQRLLAAVADPHRRYATVHVGGTNGKGSVAATIASILQQAGHRTGLYSSPHLTTFRERIRIDGVAISETALVAAATRLWPHITAETPSFFEATTAIGFLALADAGVDIAVIEVGLGGRLDATNVIAPELVVLTNVSLDHVQLLGRTVEEVAAEKAGIIKRGVPVITGETNPVVRAQFEQRAREVGAPFRALPPDAVRELRCGIDGTRFRADTAAWGALDVHTPLVGGHQARNAALALGALELLPPRLRPAADAVLAGARLVAWPGRAQVVQHAGVTWVFDVAHNAAGVHALVETLEALSMLRPLEAVGDRVLLTLPPTAPPDRRWDPAAVLAEVPAPHAHAVADFTSALQAAHQHAAGGTIVVTGSFHTVGDALIALNLAPWGADVALPRPSLAV
jgi:dihydrofolate synthase/folylpolyglutamate synthase